MAEPSPDVCPVCGCRLRPDPAAERWRRKEIELMATALVRRGLRDPLQATREAIAQIRKREEEKRHVFHTD